MEEGTSKAVPMDLDRLDRIHIHALRCRCVLGLYPEERHQARDVLISLSLYFKNPDAAMTDNINLTIDYAEVADEIQAHVNGTRYKLIESLAESIAGLLLKRQSILACRVTVVKTGVPNGAHSTAVEIIRERA